MEWNKNHIHTDIHNVMQFALLMLLYDVRTLYWTIGHYTCKTKNGLIQNQLFRV